MKDNLYPSSSLCGVHSCKWVCTCVVTSPQDVFVHSFIHSIPFHKYFSNADYVSGTVPDCALMKLMD